MKPELSTGESIKGNMPERWDRVRLYSRFARLIALNIPRMFLHRIRNFGDYSPERRERDDVAFEGFDVKAARYILEKEIGTLDFQCRTADRLQEIRERRELPQSTLAKEM